MDGQGMTEKCVPETESPVYREIRIIGERLAETEKTSQLLAGRLSKILSDPCPADEKDAEQPEFKSALEQSLHTISCTIDSNTSFLKHIIGRLTI